MQNYFEKLNILNNDDNNKATQDYYSDDEISEYWATFLWCDTQQSEDGLYYNELSF